MAALLQATVRAQRAAEIRAACIRRAVDSVPTLTPREERAITRSYRPRHTVYGDTPTTQWTNLTALAVASRISQKKGHRP